MIPLILENLGGRARARQVLTEIEMDVHFRSGDFAILSNIEERWKNWARWVREDLVRDGILRADSSYGWWELA